MKYVGQAGLVSPEHVEIIFGVLEYDLDVGSSRFCSLNYSGRVTCSQNTWTPEQFRVSCSKIGQDFAQPIFI